jgi:hypothetical protein
VAGEAGNYGGRGGVVKGSVRCMELCISRQCVYHRCELGPDIAGCGEVGQGRVFLQRDISGNVMRAC